MQDERLCARCCPFLLPCMVLRQRKVYLLVLLTVKYNIRANTFKNCDNNSTWENKSNKMRSVLSLESAVLWR